MLSSFNPTPLCLAWCSYYLVVPLTLLSAPALAAVISAGETLLATRQLQALRLLPVGQVAAALTPLQLTASQ